MGKKAERFKRAFRKESTNKKEFDTKDTAMQDQFIELGTLMGTLESLKHPTGGQHPSLGAYRKIRQSLINTRDSLRTLAQSHPADAVVKQMDLEDELETALVDLRGLVNDIEKMKSGDFDDLAHGGKSMGDVSDAALRAQKELETAMSEIEGCPEHLTGIRKRFDKQLTRLQRDITEVNQLLSQAENADPFDVKALQKTQKKCRKAYDKLHGQAKAFRKQLADLVANDITLDVQLNGKNVHIDKRAVPGIDDLDETAKQEFLAEVGAKIERGKKLAAQVLDSSVDLDSLDAPSRKDVADLIWYIKTLSEMKVGDPHEKGALTLPDPDNRLRKFIDKCSEVYTRNSSHLEEQHSKGKLKSVKGDGGTFGRGIDFYDGDTENVDTMLPYGLNTALVQSVKTPDGDEKLFLKMETEGAPFGPAGDLGSVAITSIPGFLMGGIIGGVGGLLGLVGGGVKGLFDSDSTVKDGAIDGAKFMFDKGLRIGGGVFATGAGLFTDAFTLGHTWTDKLAKDGKDMPRSRVRGGVKDWWHNWQHTANFLGGHKDSMAAYRESFKGRKTLLGEELEHPVKEAVASLVAPLAGADSNEVKELGKAIAKKAKRVNDVFDALVLLLDFAEEVTEDAEKARTDEDHTAKFSTKDSEALALAAGKLQAVLDVLTFEYDVETPDDVDSRFGDEIVLTEEDLGMDVSSGFSSEALKVLESAKEAVAFLRTQNGLAKRSLARIQKAQRALESYQKSLEGDENSLGTPSEIMDRINKAQQSVETEMRAVRGYRQAKKETLVVAAFKKYEDYKKLPDPKAFLKEHKKLKSRGKDYTTQIDTLAGICRDAAEKATSIYAICRAIAYQLDKDGDLGVTPQTIVNDLEILEKDIGRLDDDVSKCKGQLDAAFELYKKVKKAGKKADPNDVYELASTGTESFQALASCANRADAFKARLEKGVPKRLAKKKAVTLAVDRSEQHLGKSREALETEFGRMADLNQKAEELTG